MASKAAINMHNFKKNDKIRKCHAAVRMNLTFYSIYTHFNTLKKKKKKKL